MVNTQHKYGYGYKPNYANKVDKIDKSLNKITEAQWNLIRLIEQYTSHKFSECEQTRRGASQFIQDHRVEYRECVDREQSALNEIPNEDKMLIKRGVDAEDVQLIREIERITGEDFSKRRQIRMEAYKFIEEFRGCLV